MIKLVFSVTEPSGDRLAAELLQALRARADVDARGIVGPAMREVGVGEVATIEAIAAMGVGPVLRRLPAILRARRALSRELDDADALVCVDAPDFHGPLIRRARRLGVPIIGYVAPQVWAWRRARIDQICRDFDVLIHLFRFEGALFQTAAQEHQCALVWSGHPASRSLHPRSSDAYDDSLWGLMPASRESELRRHLPIFLSAAAHLRAQQSTARFLLPVRDGLREKLPPLPAYIDIVPAGTDSLLRCRGVLSKSGTSTLELALSHIPQVVAHRVGWLTWSVGRLVVSDISHIALPNILCRSEVVPEFRQDLRPRQLAKALLELPRDQPVDLEHEVHNPDGISSAADAIIKSVHEKRAASAGSLWWPALVVVVIATLLRVLIAAEVELAEDEAYYWVWSRSLAGGYLDHPPAIAALIRAGTEVLGDTELGVRAGAILASAGSALVAASLSNRRGLAVLALCSAPLFALGGVLATPDAPLVASWTLALWACCRRRLLLAGAFMGLAMLSKYTGLLLLPALVISAGTAPWRRRSLWGGLTIAALIYAPNAIWNLTHDAISWRFQLNHVVQTSAPLDFIAAQFGLVGPLTMLAVMVWLAARTRSSDTTDRILWWGSAPLWLAAVLAGGEATWAAPAVVGPLIALSRTTGRIERAFSIGVGLNVALVLLAAIHLAWRPLVDLPHDPRDRVFGGKTLGESVAAWDIPEVITSRYQEAALIQFYGGVPARTLPGHSRTDHYDLTPWEPPEHALYVRVWRGHQGTPTDQRGYDRSGPNTVTAAIPSTRELVPRPVARWQVFELWRKSPPDAPVPWSGLPDVQAAP